MNDLKLQIATLTKTLEEEKNKTLKKEKEIAKEQKEIFMDKIIKDLEFLPKGAKLFKIENGDMIHQVNGKFRVGEFKDGIFVDLKDDAGKIITPEVFLKKRSEDKEYEALLKPKHNKTVDIYTTHSDNNKRIAKKII